MKKIRQNNFRGNLMMLYLALLLAIPAILVLIGVLPHDGESGLVYAWLFLGVSLIFFGITWMGYTNNKRAYQTFYDRFPELNGSMASVMENAEFVSPKLGVLIYQNHLLGYKKGDFRFVDIAQLTSVKYEAVYRRRKGMEAILICVAEPSADRVMTDSNKQESAVIEVIYRGKAASPLLDELYAYLYSKNSEIVFK